MGAWVPALGAQGQSVVNLARGQSTGRVLSAETWKSNFGSNGITAGNGTDYNPATVSLGWSTDTQFGSGNFTVISVVAGIGNGFGTDMCYLGPYNNATKSSSRWAIMLSTTAGSGTTFILETTTGSQTVSGGSASAKNRIYAVGGRRTRSSLEVFRDGIVQTAPLNIGTQVQQSGGNQSILVGALSYGTDVESVRFNSSMMFYGLLVYLRSLNNEEMLQVSADPLAPFRLRRRVIVRGASLIHGGISIFGSPLLVGASEPSLGSSIIKAPGIILP